MPSSVMGELVTETFNYDGGRQVTAYVPPVPPKAVVFAGDGQLISQWGGVLEAADVPPTMIVGTHRPDDEMLRLHEYSPALWTLSIWMLSIATRSRACTARRYRTVEIQADPVSSPPPTYCPPVLGPADITGGAGTRTHP